MCEGFSLDDTLALQAADIAEYGFIVVGVGPPPKFPHVREWAYTVGLLDLADHPELIVVGPSFDVTGPLLNTLGRAAAEGERLHVGDTIQLGQLGTDVARVGGVHPVQYGLDTFNMWHNHEANGDLRVGELEALQILVPNTWFCAHHEGVQPDLADPDVRVDAMPTANRAMRRAARRGGRRDR
jgi:hypothetical protein